MEKNKILIALDKTFSYLQARKIERAVGKKMSSHVLLDDFVTDPDRSKNAGHVSQFFARELWISPGMNKTFRKGRDVIDELEDQKGMKWVLPASYVPEGAVGKEKLSLLADPEDVKIEAYNGGQAVVVHPQLVNIIHPSIQFVNYLSGGKVDPITRFPIEVPVEVFAKLPDGEKRFFHGPNETAVRAVRRDIFGRHGGNRRIYIVQHDDACNIAIEVSTDALSGDV